MVGKTKGLALGLSPGRSAIDRNKDGTRYLMGPTWRVSERCRKPKCTFISRVVSKSSMCSNWQARRRNRSPRPPELLFDFGGFDHFLDFLGWMGGLVRTPDQAARVAYRFAAREAASGVRYADVVINLTHWPAWQGPA